MLPNSKSQIVIFLCDGHHRIEAVIDIEPNNLLSFGTAGPLPRRAAEYRLQAWCRRASKCCPETLPSVHELRISSLINISREIDLLSGSDHREILKSAESSSRGDFCFREGMTLAWSSWLPSSLSTALSADREQKLDSVNFLLCAIAAVKMRSCAPGTSTGSGEVATCRFPPWRAMNPHDHRRGPTWHVLVSSFAASAKTMQDMVSWGLFRLIQIK